MEELKHEVNRLNEEYLQTQANFDAAVAAQEAMQEQLNLLLILISDPVMLNPEFNRIYGQSARDEGFMPTYFTVPLLYGPARNKMFKYPCPNGWRRISLKVDDFEKYRTWHVGYHGTRHGLIGSILEEGLRAAVVTCHKRMGDTVVYFTPSIKYAQHPRYAKNYLVDGKYCQVILMARINHEAILNGPQAGTLPGAFARDPQCDPHFPNRELEWLVNHSLPKGENYIIYGVMTRVLPVGVHPKDLPENKWIPADAWSN